MWTATAIKEPIQSHIITKWAAHIPVSLGLRTKQQVLPAG
jgi:hypothetical protein